jgi:putative transcriptional regulator
MRRIQVLDRASALRADYLHMTHPSDTPLRRLRLRRQKSLDEVAAAIGVHNSTLSRIERGGETTAKVAADLVKFYGQDITEMEILYPDRFPSTDLSPPEARPSS